MARTDSVRQRVRRKRGIAAALAVLVLGGSLAVSGSSPAAATGFLGMSLYSLGDNQIQFSICFNAVDQLPARIDGSFTVTQGGTTVLTGNYSAPEPTVTLVSIDPCPTAYLTLDANDLQSGTAYVVNATMTVTPKIVNSDDGEYIDDPNRPPVTATESLSVTTTGGGGGGDSGGGGGGGGTSGGPSGGTSGGTGGGSSGGTSGSGGGTSGGTSGETITPVVIPNPVTFTATQLAALSPAEIATITPSDFGQLPPATFRALKPAQAAEITPEQASTIRPARAAELTARAVAALDPESVSAMRPAAIKFLTPGAVGAMTSAQLKALTPRQVGALRPVQLAELSAAQKALLRRR